MQKNRVMKFEIIFILTAICTLMVSCGMSDTEKQKANDLVSRQKTNFVEQAVRQYGSDAKVKNIRAETRTIYDPLYGIPSEKVTTGNLAGDITVDKEMFHGVYLLEAGKVYSDRNYENIVQTVKAFFGIPDSAILDVTLTDSAYLTYYLPDEITTFEDMLENQYFMLVHIYTTADLSHFTQEDFSKLYRFYENYEDSTGYVVLVQLDNDSNLEALQREINSITFEYEDHHGKVYDNESHGYVDAFEKYQIKGALYLDERRFIYNR